MNRIILTGNLGHGATVRDVQKADNSGTTPVVNFSLAVKVGYGANAETTWYKCSWWGERAEKCAQWLTRGRRVLVEGEPGLRFWKKRDGSGEGAEIAVRVSNLELLSDGRAADESAPPESLTTAPFAVPVASFARSMAAPVAMSAFLTLP